MTALFHHFATQPLPTPAAFTFNFMPRTILVFGVVITYIIELTLPLLLLLPSNKIRRTCCIIIALFQAVIAFSGNYTFFNLLTVVLCVGSCAGSTSSRAKPAAKGQVKGERRTGKDLLGNIILVLLVLSIIVGSSVYLFDIDMTGEKAANLVTASPAMKSVILLRDTTPTLTNFGGFEVRSTKANLSSAVSREPSRIWIDIFTNI